MNASLNEKLRTVKWGEYKLGDLFKPQKITKMLSKEVLSDEFCFPVYSSESTNNGIIGYTDSPEFMCDDEHPIFVTFGDHTRSFNIATKSFSVLDNVKVLLPSIHNIRCLLWIVTAWQKQIPNLGYARHWKIAKNCIVELPTKEGKIDFNFMESFIAELEAERIAELSAYLTVSGLDNYELSSEEQNAIMEFRNKAKSWGEYKLGDLFEIVSYKKRFDANKVTVIEEGGHPYIVRQSTENGKKGNIEASVEYLNDGNTISFGQDTATMFYQEEPYFTGDKIKILKPKYSRFGKKNAQFFLAAMRKAFYAFGWGSSRFNVGTIADQTVLLPQTSDCYIDFDFMELLISAVQKLVIKDVVLYANQKIAATKEVVAKR